MLSAADRKFYEDNGFFVVRKLVSESNLEEFRQRFQDICDKKVRTELSVVGTRADV